MKSKKQTARDLYEASDLELLQTGAVLSVTELDSDDGEVFGIVKEVQRSSEYLLDLIDTHNLSVSRLRCSLHVVCPLSVSFACRVPSERISIAMQFACRVPIITYMYVHVLGLSTS